MATSIPGLFYYPNIISSEREARILAQIDAQPWSTALSRRTQHYGYLYNYKSTQLEPAPPITGELQFVADYLVQQHVMEKVDMCIVNEYLRNQGITPHIDSSHFGPVVVSISLRENTVMYFQKDTTRIPILLERGSVVAMSGEARYSWKHSIPSTVKYTRPDNTIVTKSADYRRISLTYRQV